MENFYKKIVRLFCAVIPVKTLRRKCRDWLFAVPDKINMYLLMRNNKNYKPYNKFYKKKIPSKGVLIVEINTFHGITLPGYIHYFKELGYDVDVLLDYKNVIDQPLCRLKDKFRAFVGTKEQLLEILRSPRIKKYSFVFINTTFYYPGGLSVIKMIGRLPEGKYGTLMIEHNLDPYVKQFGEEKYIKNGTLFTLLGFRNTKMLFPGYVGKTRKTYKNKEITKFVVVGNISQSCRNYIDLVKASEILINKRIENFEVIVIGWGTIENIPENVLPHIKLLGQLDYPDMYKEIEKADFLLTLMDSKISEHHKYLDNWATGANILIHAFLKPCLIDSFFAKSYFFNKDNALLYNANLAKAMEEAIKMSQSDYKHLLTGLEKLRKQLYQESLKNLGKTLLQIKRKANG